MAGFGAGFDRKTAQKLLLLLVVAGQFWGVLLATFSLKTGHLPTFDLELARNLQKFTRKKGRKWRKTGHLPTFCPLLFSKVARLKPLRPKGLRVFWPLSHFFSSLKCEKKY